jgi:hypothetical protein
MSAARKGREIQSTEDEVVKQARHGVTTTGAPTDDGQGGATTRSFPRHFDSGTDAWDKVSKLKRGMVVDPATAMTPFGPLEFSDRDAHALLAKENAAKEMAFDGWFGQNFHKNDLPTRRLAQELNPDYYAQREALLVAKAKMALRIKLMQLRGPRSEEDLQILYGLQSGDIRLETGWDTIGWTTNPNNASDAAYARKELSTSSRLFVPLGARADAGPGLVGFANQPFVPANAAAVYPFGAGAAPVGDTIRTFTVPAAGAAAARVLDPVQSIFSGLP